MEENKIRIAITHGDTNGIGYETIFKTFADPAMLELCTPIIYGSPKIAAYHRKTLGIQANFSIISKADDAHADRLNMLTCFDDEVKVELGTPTAVSSMAARKALVRALGDAGEGLVDAVVTLPMSDIAASGEDKAADEAQTEKTSTPLVIHVNNDLRIASATGDIPLADALRLLTKELIVEKATTLHETLRRDFRLSNPRIALLQVNPQPGTEEQEILKPAIEDLHAASVGAFGPYPADTFFSQFEHMQFDAILTMYHDQAMPSFRLLSQEADVTFTAGLPFIVTSPGFGPQFEAAGKGTADESALRHALYLAIDAVRHRRDYDAPLANPLKKLYHEKRDESEKVRFTIPKKHEQH
ncbi:MAG: 4-hydroxythreonine-4-phosphate dehydrogenase PdxA [Prevotella sp.]|nr:4-hydroxythreonine-4-phosphate dehydrogenase PdxA [Prevotella sp.]MBO4658640.1 4-hydroxythreonine-4-phosphate dehydrogenase PdxA [Prevotella sp.]